MKRLRVHQDAESELDAAIAWYNLQRDGLGMAFYAAIARVFDRITSHPEAGVRADVSPYRVCLTPRFPYAVYFIDAEDAIWIAAIAHTRRHPDYWKRRISEA